MTKAFFSKIVLVLKSYMPVQLIINKKIVAKNNTVMMIYFIYAFLFQEENMHLNAPLPAHPNGLLYCLVGARLVPSSRLPVETMSLLYCGSTRNPNSKLSSERYIIYNSQPLMQYPLI